MQSKPGFYLAVFATFLAFFVVGLGAYTRLTHAGLGCPDWPGCYGFLTVPESTQSLQLAQARYPDAPVETEKGWIEMAHRYAAGLLILVVLALLFQCIRHRKTTGQPLFHPLLIFVLILFQAIFGMWTVTLKLWPQIVTTHLLGGFSLLCLLFLLSLRLAGFNPVLKKVSYLPQLRTVTTVSLLVVFLQIMLGGWTSANYAALACPDFPQCQNQWWPDTDFSEGFSLSQSPGPNYQGGILASDARTAIHMAHRIGAAIVLLFLAILIFLLMKARLYKSAGIISILLVLQIILGIGNIAGQLPLGNAVAHNLGGALLLLSIVGLAFYFHRYAQQRRVTTEKG
ncbi:Heme A synthase [invertebrate metagenome]|uniref:Heme A synthase n=1 Tax=invertebrate metagenome TaxID=1711999 RepID=A0A2H9T8Q0_9ZZZZ